MNYSVSEENYIKAIFHLQGEGETVTTNALAAELKTRPASVTDMLKKLKTKKLVNYQPYHGFRLSPEGKKTALGIIRRHRLWEYFLSEKLKFDWNEVHEVAEHLEHVSSRKLIDKLEEYLGYPKFDPHGDPIPDSSGKMESSPQTMLSQLEPTQAGVVIQVSNQSPALLELLSARKIGIGTRIELIRKFAFDGSVEIRIGRSAPFIISEQLASNLFIRK
ncbi:MAG: metal-dependent transcriptional regulator [Chitinophagaceae bacterium]|nr:metal-dependent transcriptional regulator [Chitinophagaceae bacterium]MBN8667605.1 metal-dependent transcriptional regulator [Chitinophagales bacterium]